MEGRAAACPKGSDVVGTRRMTGGGRQENGGGGSHHCGRGISLESSELSAPISLKTVEGGEGPLQRSLRSPKHHPTL